MRNGDVCQEEKKIETIETTHEARQSVENNALRKPT